MSNTMAVSTYSPPDYYLLDDLLSEEHKMIRQSVRDWVDRRVMPHIEEWAQNNECPTHLIPEIGELQIFGAVAAGGVWLCRVGQCRLRRDHAGS